jgi:predicted acyl esterase
MRGITWGASVSPPIPATITAEKILFPFFEQYLKAGADARICPRPTFSRREATSGGNIPPGLRNDLQSRRSIFTPTASFPSSPPARRAQSAFDEYVSDPLKPVPFVGYIAADVPQEYMLSDQRFAELPHRRPLLPKKVLDEDITLAGPISPHLFVSTSGTDSDFDVKLIDVYPADYPEANRRPGKPPARRRKPGTRNRRLAAPFRHGRIPATGERRAFPREVPQ